VKVLEICYLFPFLFCNCLFK